MADEIMGVPGTDASSTAVTEEDVKKYLMGALEQQAEKSREYYEMLARQINTLKEKEMAEVMTPSMIMGGGSGDGLFGGAGAGGLIGGLILGSLLRNGRGGFLGDGDGGVGGAVLRNPPEQNQANMDLMQAIGAVDKATAVSTAAMEASQATQTLGITTQLSSIASALTNNINQLNTNTMAGFSGVNQNIMENRYELSKDISSDGEKTRALITAQYEATLNRQLQEANAALIELRSDARLAERTRGVEVTTTNNINQMQQQQQQQAQYGQLANLIWGLAQNIRSNNEAINVGSGTLTANPTNTNTNIR